MTAAPDAHVRSIHDLRGIAAVLVVVHHALAARAMSLPDGVTLDLGRPAVMVFFVISGFVMVHSCRREPVATFAARRVIRVVPLYWMATLAFYVLAFRKDLAAGTPFARLDELLASLLFVPHWNATSPDRIWPILVPGWTLDFEMFFFALFGLGLLVRDIRLTGLVLIGLVLVGFAIDWNDPRFLTWTSPFLLLFLAGMALAWGWRHLPLGILWPLGPVGLALSAWGAAGGAAFAPADLIFGFGAVLIVTGALAAERRRPDLGRAVPRVLGDASYAIYLTHILVLIALAPLLRALPLEGWSRLVLLVPAATGVCVVTGIAIHRAVERPLTRILRRAIEKGGPPPTRPGAALGTGS